jgi:hypothetical protein
MRKTRIATISIPLEVDVKARAFGKKTRRNFSEVVTVSLERLLESENETAKNI